MQTVTVVKEVEVEVGIEGIQCSSCGSDLNITKIEKDGYGDLILEVEPCDCQKGMI